jgi:3-(3-hydroxy-phenyl)propionate hydroxylase
MNITDRSPASADVIIVGYGPVGRMLALKLGRQGHRVIVIERQAQSYPLPRAAHVDDEACRILQSVGASPSSMPDAIEPYEDFYEWRNADGETLLRLDWRRRGPSGWQVANFFHQPAIERHLDALVDMDSRITLLRGLTATRYEEIDGGVVVTAVSEGTEHVFAGKYLVGADGANSNVRSWIGGTATDPGYFHDWLVLDLAMKDESIRFAPPAWQLCDPARPTTLVPAGPGRRRFEFMRLPGETVKDLELPSAAWAMLAPWGIDPAVAELERQTVYTFQARWQDTWQRGRAFIVGDAAHLMPPFAGQGMCSGLRDAVNLAWKLDLVLRGLAPDALLESYEPERKEHVRHFIETSMELGAVICVTNAQEAAERDRQLRERFLSGEEMPPRPLPRLGDGFFDPDAGGGILSIQAMVESNGQVGLWDDVVGEGGSLIMRSDHAVDEVVGEALRARGIAIATIGDGLAPGSVRDVEGSLDAWLGESDAIGVVVRPDFYVFGFAKDAAHLESLSFAFIGGRTSS